MKTLKLEHEFAQQVLIGEKTATWQMFDDKDFSVNDIVELIDKVDSKDPTTWRGIGTARINVVVEKRLSEVDHNDMQKFTASNKAEMLLKFQQYYGPHVTLETPVKMIHFSVLPQSAQNNSNNVVLDTPKLHEAKLYTDGGSRGNPGPSASGYVILDMQDQIVVKKGNYLGITTNNQAEYQALKFGLEEALRLHISQLHVFMDSMLVINQMKGIFKVKNRDLWPIHEAIKELSGRFEHISFTHVPRELNKIADKAVNDALDEAAKQQL